MIYAPTQGAGTNTPFVIGAMIGFSILMPLFQGLFTYLFIRLSLWIYNKLFKTIGGIEFEYSELH